MSEQTNENQAAPGPPPRPDCLCMGLGPELTQLIRRLGTADDAWENVRTASVEVLKALRALIDERIAALDREPARGTKVKIE